MADLGILNTPILLSITFNVLNEIDRDDRGVSEIKIFIDHQLFLSYCPDPSETSFFYIIFGVVQKFKNVNIIIIMRWLL